MFESSETDSFASLLEKLQMEHGLTDEALVENQPVCSLRESRDTVNDVAVQLGFNVVQCCQLNLYSTCTPKKKGAKMLVACSSQSAFVVLLLRVCISQ